MEIYEEILKDECIECGGSIEGEFYGGYLCENCFDNEEAIAFLAEIGIPVIKGEMEFDFDWDD